MLCNEEPKEPHIQGFTFYIREYSLFFIDCKYLVKAKRMSYKFLVVSYGDALCASDYVVVGTGVS